MCVYILFMNMAGYRR